MGRCSVLFKCYLLGCVMMSVLVSTSASQEVVVFQNRLYISLPRTITEVGMGETMKADKYWDIPTYQPTLCVPSEM